MNNWDKELVQFKLHLEVNCTKFKMCHIKWSPEVGFWLSGHSLLAHIKVYVMGLGPPNPSNLIRDCLHLHLLDPRCVSYSKVMIHTKVTHQKLLELPKMPQHYVASIFLISKRLHTREVIQLDQQSYLRFSPKNKRERNGVESITQPARHRRQSPYNTCSSWHSSQSIWYQAGSCGSHLGPSVWTPLSGIFCTLLPRTTFWWPRFHGGHRMLQTNPRGNVWVPTQHQRLDKEDIAGSTLYLFTYVRRQDSNHNFYRRFSITLDKGSRTDIILFQQCHLLALQSSSISFNALGNAHGVSVWVRMKRDPPCTLGHWAHCATGEDSWQ